ncbi:nuclear transport factor 2 family protein [Solimonas sp. K1W22B-7]|uniref:nuclear transport factor 2 family protein n=1 Tax=Solimonas sp. K1W22B-7 TaxID=2303331 RepID=UPI000E3351A1|nr:nuclear transport factor 2 family protein [Solimonas sp. K1W22B-7]AXQ29589.1 nuclear transport factor 2 family protein [Solimonas sp. K1W22B-7]
MKSPKDLLNELLSTSFVDPAASAALFAEDGAFEMPYLTSFGWPGRYEGRVAIAEFFGLVRSLYPNLAFERPAILIEAADQVFAEYGFAATSVPTGRAVRHLFMGRLVAEDGYIKLLRESVNAVEIARAVFPQGVPDLPADAPWSPLQPVANAGSR